MSQQAQLYAVASSEELVIEALDARREELGLSMIALDDMAGFAAGTSAKYLSPSQVKNFGLRSILKMTRGLGLRVVFEIDPKQTQKVLQRRNPKRKSQARPKNYAQQPSIRVYRRVRSAMGKKGAQIRNANLTPEQRSERARHAAVIRWNDIKQVVKSGGPNEPAQ